MFGPKILAKTCWREGLGHGPTPHHHYFHVMWRHNATRLHGTRLVASLSHPPTKGLTTHFLHALKVMHVGNGLAGQSEQTRLSLYLYSGFIALILSLKVSAASSTRRLICGFVCMLVYLLQRGEALIELDCAGYSLNPFIMQQVGCETGTHTHAQTHANSHDKQIQNNNLIGFAAFHPSRTPEWQM